jgi:hypothetical protein
MKKHLLLITVWVACITAAMSPLAFAQGQAARVDGKAYVSGGVGEDEAQRMAALGNEYNLKLLFAAKDGHYLADVAVTISDARGGTVLEAVAEGPFLFTRLAPGKYQVAASYGGVAQKRDTTIAASGRRELIFRWEEQAD